MPSRLSFVLTQLAQHNQYRNACIGINKKSIVSLWKWSTFNKSCCNLLQSDSVNFFILKIFTVTERARPCRLMQGQQKAGTSWIMWGWSHRGINVTHFEKHARQ